MINNSLSQTGNTFMPIQTCPNLFATGKWSIAKIVSYVCIFFLILLANYIIHLCAGPLAQGVTDLGHHSFIHSSSEFLDLGSWSLVLGEDGH